MGEGNISDVLTVTYDLNGDDEACLIIGRQQGRTLKIIKHIKGSEAEKLYEKLSEWSD